MFVLKMIVGDKAQESQTRLFTPRDMVKDLVQALLEDCINLQWVKPYFERAAFVLLTSKIATRRKSAVYLCATCQLDTALHTKAVACDRCLQWHHMKCVNAKGNAPKSRFWFCRKCSSEHQPGHWKRLILGLGVTYNLTLFTSVLKCEDFNMEKIMFGFFFSIIIATCMDVGKYCSSVWFCYVNTCTQNSRWSRWQNNVWSELSYVSLFFFLFHWGGGERGIRNKSHLVFTVLQFFTALGVCVCVD